MQTKPKVTIVGCCQESCKSEDAVDMYFFRAVDLVASAVTSASCLLSFNTWFCETTVTARIDLIDGTRRAIDCDSRGIFEAVDGSGELGDLSAAAAPHGGHLAANRAAQVGDSWLC